MLVRGTVEAQPTTLGLLRPTADTEAVEFSEGTQNPGILANNPLQYRLSSPGSPFHAVRSTKKKTPWSESASELYRPSDRRLSAK
jgi:hypothetical protein